MTEPASERPSLATYLDRRMPRILLLGMISGFPWVLIASSLTLWLKEEGLSRSTIGWATLIFGVYGFNWLWAPLVDRIRLPWLTERIGQRKAWILALQAVILLSMLLWSTLDPSTSLAPVIAVGLAIAIASATQDITIDALRIEQVEPDEKAAMAAGAAVAVVGWWTGFKLGGAISLWLADGLEKAGFANYWQLTFLCLCLAVLAMNQALLYIPEAPWQARRERQREDQARLIGDGAASAMSGASSPTASGSPAQWIARRAAASLAWLASTIVSPIASFFRTNGVSIALAILAFLFLFKIGEAFVGRMSIVFYKEVGFSKSDIALYSKTWGWITTVVFTLIGGWFAVKHNVVRALFIAGIAMAATNLLFSLMAMTAAPSKLLFASAVILDDITAAIATVVFVTFISLLVDRTYTATQYALLASIGTAGRTLVAAASGSMVDGLGGNWALFFVLTAVMVLPSLGVLVYLRHRMPALSETPRDAPNDPLPATT